MISTIINFIEDLPSFFSAYRHLKGNFIHKFICYTSTYNQFRDTHEIGKTSIQRNKLLKGCKKIVLPPMDSYTLYDSYPIFRTIQNYYGYLISLYAFFSLVLFSLLEEPSDLIFYLFSIYW